MTATNAKIEKINISPIKIAKVSNSIEFPLRGQTVLSSSILYCKK